MRNSSLEPADLFCKTARTVCDDPQMRMIEVCTDRALLYTTRLLQRLATGRIIDDGVRSFGTDGCRLHMDDRTVAL